MARAKATAAAPTTEAEAATAQAAEAPVIGTDVPEAAVASASAGQGRAVILPDGTRRIDYIKKRWAEKASRSTIAKELTILQGKPVPYQIVFQATKGLAGGPDPAPATPPEATAEATDADTEGEAAA